MFNVEFKYNKRLLEARLRWHQASERTHAAARFFTFHPGVFFWKCCRTRLTFVAYVFLTEMTLFFNFAIFFLHI